jgi:hypothetical protein
MEHRHCFTAPDWQRPGCPQQSQPPRRE